MSGYEELIHLFLFPVWIPVWMPGAGDIRQKISLKPIPLFRSIFLDIYVFRCNYNLYFCVLFTAFFFIGDDLARQWKELYSLQLRVYICLKKTRCASCISFKQFIRSYTYVFTALIHRSITQERDKSFDVWISIRIPLYLGEAYQLLQDRIRFAIMPRTI